ncbi:MAG: FAD-binding protein [Nitriliruptoraceae bacterium]
MTQRPTITDQSLLDFADEVGPDGPIAVQGARTRWDVGGPVRSDTRITDAPSGIVNHRPEEMTVSVYAGTPVAELHQALRQFGQRTALPDRGGTVGGALAVGENDLMVRAVGRVRHALLQVRYVAADGQIVTGGGPTVKNVSGFDLPRLMVGSLGTLGLIAEVVLRTNPVPETSVWLSADSVDALAVNEALFHPAAVLWDRRDDRDTTWVCLEGYAADVNAEREVLAPHGSFEQVAPPSDLPVHRWSLEPSALATLDPASLGGFVASVGVGIVLAGRRQSPREPDATARSIAARIKREFDPDGRFNPGRDPAVR